MKTDKGDEMKERPILFSAPMVRAILAGTKTQTRRLVKNSAKLDGNGFMPLEPDVAKCPYGQPGDRLWVRETLTSIGHLMGYKADRTLIDCGGINWPNLLELRDTIPSIHMPRWASRILLEITGVRVERLQNISDDDARQEGVAEWAAGALSPEVQQTICRQEGFRMLWEQTYGADSWAADPWVWVVEFKRVQP